MFVDLSQNEKFGQYNPDHFSALSYPSLIPVVSGIRGQLMFRVKRASSYTASGVTDLRASNRATEV